MGYAVAPSGSVQRVLRELTDADRKEVIGSLKSELRGELAFNTVEIPVERPDGEAPYWLTVLSCGWQAAYRRLTDAELGEFAAEHGRPSPYLGFYLADLHPIDPIGPSTTSASRLW